MKNITVRKYQDSDIIHMINIWNEVVEDGEAFPQEEPLSETSGKTFFESQSFCGVAEVNGEILGMYILHPNNVGRCGHISNASYAVKSSSRGMRIGEVLVRDSVARAGELGFGILQFNAVVESNTPARLLYEKLGFKQLGTIEGGFRKKDGSYENICPYYIKTK